MRRLVIFDRDGVINHDSEHYIRSPEEWVAIDGSLEAIASINRAGFLTALATNQAGVAKGIFSEDTLAQIHGKMIGELSAVGGKLDRIFACVHHPDQRCDCRKPQPGMLLQACSHFNVLPQDTIFVGDSLRDLQAASGAGCIPVLVLTGNGKITRACAPDELPADLLEFESLEEFAKTLLNDALLGRSSQ